jgi:outer membrane lipoprotein carrier protein
VAPCAAFVGCIAGLFLAVADAQAPGSSTSSVGRADHAGEPSAVAVADRGRLVEGEALVDRWLAEVQTFRADFEQGVYSSDERLVESASGSLSLRRPDEFRWSYKEPYAQQIVADGKNIWIYDVDLEQVTVTPMDEAVASTPAMLLSGDRAVRDGFKVVETFSRDDLEWVRLVPQSAGTDFASVLLGFAGDEPRRLELVDGLGQVTRIEFSAVELNPRLPRNTFDFRVPRGVDVIGTPG